MSTSKSNKKSAENKKMKALFSAVCLCMMALGLIIYYSAEHKSPTENQVNEQTTLEVTQAVQNPVTARVSETQTETTKAATTETVTKKAKKKKQEPATMEQGESNTPYKSYYKYPLGEAVAYGYSEEPVYNETMGDWRAHAAVDFKGKEGDEVCAINDGLVLKVSKDSLYDYTVVIDHGGKLTATYAGLHSVAVKEGKYVTIGQELGTLGKAPAESALGTHLHFETSLDGKPVNPLDVMGKTE